MSRKLVIFIALAMVCALVAATDEVEEAEFVPLVHFNHEASRVARSPSDAKKKLSCADKRCVTACVMENGAPKCV